VRRVRPRPGPGPIAYRLAVGLAAAVVVVRSALLVVGGLDRLQRLGLSDPVWPALAVLLALLLAPYVSEVEAVGTKVVRLPPGTARDAGDELAQLAAGGVDTDAVLSADERAELAASRYLGLQLALSGAPPLFPELAPLRLHVYVPDDELRLVPVLEHDDPADAWARGWDLGVGVVGRAFARRRVQVGRGPALQAELAGLPDKPVEAFADLRVVVAVPLLNLAGRPVGVLSASAVDGDPDPSSPELRLSLEALASGLARVLVDLAAWDTDDAAGPAGATGG
jgi:hypothetical protein